MRRLIRKVDGNHGAVRDRLRLLGWRVFSVAGVPGFVDLIAQDSGGAYLIEVKKNAKATLRPAQIKLQCEGWVIYRMDSVEDAEAWSVQFKQHAEIRRGNL